MGNNNRDVRIITWACTIVASIVILLRIVGRKWRKQKYFYDDYLVMVSLLPLLSRAGMIDIVLLYGTNNVASTEGFTAEDIRQHEIGSKLTLGTRILYAGFVWLMKFSLIVFYARLTHRQRGYVWVIRITKALIPLTFIGVIFSTLLECRPFNQYWQVVPKPNKACTKAEAQLLTMGLCNIFTDLLLIAIPLPLIFRALLPFWRKIQLAALFGVSFFLVAICVIRLPLIVGNSQIQRARTLWASVEIVASALVVNFPILYTFWKAPKDPKSTSATAAMSGAASLARSNAPGSYVPKRRPSRWSLEEADLLRNEGEHVNIIIETKQEISQDIISDVDLEKATGAPIPQHDVTTSIWTEHSNASSHTRVESRHSRHQMEQS